MTTAIPQEELPILESITRTSVTSIRNRLTALKRDRGEYIKASDVDKLYQAIIKQVTRLNDVRDDVTKYNNRVDATLADVFTLLSLFFLTIGRTKEGPATYSQIASMRQILDHMNESAVYSEADLAPFHRRLADLRRIVQTDKEKENSPVAMAKLLERELNQCEALLQSLLESLQELSPELLPIHERLVVIRRQLVTLAARGDATKAELKPIQEELRKIDSKRVDGKFLGPGGFVPASQAICSSLLEECFDVVQEIKAQEESKHVGSALKPIYDRLTEIRAELESLVMTHRWSLRETDLWNYSLSLQEIDKMRIDGNFVDSEGNKPRGQYVLLYLLRRCYGLIYRLLSSSEPVSEELMPVANKLSTVKKCLNEVLKYGGPWSPRELYPYQLALHQIDSMRKEGKFVGADGSIPEGQAIVVAHLSECHELVEMLKESMDENGGDDLYTDDDDAQQGEDYDDDSDA